MGRRFDEERIKKAGVAFYHLWLYAGRGRWNKRQLSKARRREWNGGNFYADFERREGKSPNKWESVCNWKDW